MSSDKIVILTEENFHSDVLASALPILVHFWAAWCGPCRMVAPTFDQLASEWEGKARIGKLNVDENQGLAAQHQISSVPTFILFKEGKMAERLMGALPKAAFDALLQRHVNA